MRVSGGFMFKAIMAAGFLSLPIAAEAALMRVTYEGVVQSGADKAGFFTPPTNDPLGNDPAGARYILDFTWDTEFGILEQTPDGLTRLQSGIGDDHPVPGTFTLRSGSAALAMPSLSFFQATAAETSPELSHLVAYYGAFEAITVSLGADIGGPLGFDQPFSGGVDPLSDGSYAYFAWEDDLGSGVETRLFFEATVDRLTIAPVPLPSGVALLLPALGCLIALRRRHRPIARRSANPC